ncbi:MAG: MFS transporter [Pseudomonadota bacterium]
MPSQNDSNQAGKVERLTLGTRLAFGSGQVAESLYNSLFNTFVTIFYNQVIGLPNTLIGIAIMLALIADAITDPIVGVISDRWRGRHGRRHPFLFAAPVPLALMIYLIFNPPQALTETNHQLGLFAWLAVTTVSSRAFLTLYQIPHLALGGELSKDQFQRSQLFSTNQIIGVIAGASIAFITWSFFFAGERVRATDGQLVPGHLDPAAYTPMILWACATVIIAIWTCAAFTYKHVPRLTQAPPSDVKFSIRLMITSISSTFRNRNYVVLIAGFFFFMIASGVYDTLTVFINTYFWELMPEQIRWFGLATGPMGVVGALASPHLMRRFDRKPVVLGALGAMTVFAQLPVTLRLFGLMPDNGDPLLLPALLANAGAFIFTVGVSGVAILGMIGDIIDENELVTGLRQEGLYYSARAFFAKASYSFGHLFAGILLDVYIRLPFNTVPGQLDDATLTRLGIVAGPVMASFAVLSLLCYRFYSLTAAQHREIIRKITDRNSLSVGESR